VSKVISLAPI
jgi:Phage integrase family